MMNALKKLLRLACLPGLLHLVCAVVLASGLLPFAASAATILNSASASFTDAGGQPVVMASNTTSLLTVPPPSPSTVIFYQYAPGATGATPIAFDGGQFDDTGSGGFLPLPAPSDLDGNVISLVSPVEVRPTHVFHAGEPVFITKNGESNLVVMSAAAYERDQARLKLYELLDAAEEDVRRGDRGITVKRLATILREARR